MSHVALSHHICPICGKQHQDKAEVLLDRRLRENAFPDNTPIVTGFELCNEDQQKLDEGYVALIGAVDNGEKTIKPEDAVRTGKLIHVKRETLRQLINIPIDDDLPMVFVDDEVIDQLVKLAYRSMKEQEQNDGE